MFGKNGKMKGEQWVLDQKENTHPCKVVFMSTCMVYDVASEEGIRKVIQLSQFHLMGVAK